MFCYHPIAEKTVDKTVINVIPKAQKKLKLIGEPGKTHERLRNSYIRYTLKDLATNGSRCLDEENRPAELLTYKVWQYLREQKTIFRSNSHV